MKGSPNDREQVVWRYREAGLEASRESKLAAAKMVMAMLFGTEWDDSKSTNYISPGVDYLSAYCGGDIEVEAMRQLEPLTGPDWSFSKELMEQVFEEFKTNFPIRNSPHKRRYWVEVIRHTKSLAPCYTGKNP